MSNFCKKKRFIKISENETLTHCRICSPKSDMAMQYYQKFIDIIHAYEEVKLAEVKLL